MNKSKRTKKTLQNSTSPELISKNHQWHEAVFSQSFIFFPSQKEWRQRLIFSMYAYFSDPDHIIFEEFLREFKIPVETFREWRRKYEDVKQAWMDVKEYIAVERKKRTMNFKMHYQSGYRDMHCYDQDWGKDVDAYHSELNKTNAEKTGDIHVHIDSVPNSDLVPKKG